MCMFGTLVVALIAGTVAYSYGVDEGKREALRGAASANFAPAPVVQPATGQTLAARGKLAAADTLETVRRQVLPRLADAVNAAGQALCQAGREAQPAPHHP